MILQEAIKDKQRILFVGDNSSKLVSLTSSILNKIGKSHDTISKDSETLSDAPLILIDESYLSSIDHHILVIGESENLDLIKKLSDKTPKAGSIVFNDEVKEIKKICKIERVDVIQLPYFPSKEKFEVNANELSAIKSLLTRLRVPEKDFFNTLEFL